MRDKTGLTKAQLKDKVRKIVTRKVAAIGASVHDDNEAQTHMRYNLRKRKGQEEKEHWLTDTNKKNRQNIQAQNDEQKTVTNSRILITRSKMTVSKEQTIENKLRKIPKWNQMKKNLTQSLKRKNHSPMTNSANSTKKAKLPPKLNKKSQKSTFVGTGKASSSVKKNVKSSSKLRTVRKGKEYISPKLKQSLGNTNPSTLKKRLRSAQVKEPISEKEMQSKSPLKRKSRGCKELSGKFADMFLNKLELVAHIDIGNSSPIHGISVTQDNLVWVNYLSNRVNLYNSSGDLLRFFDLDYHPVFNCCMPSGDLLVTTGFSTGAKPTIEYISRKGNTRLLADLSTHADLLCGILYQDERIYVIGDRYIILKVDMNGEVEKDFEIESTEVNVNHLISQNGQIFVLNNDIFSMYLLGSDEISTKVINKVEVDKSYSASASVDNFGNIIVGVDPPASKIVVIDPRLERKHEIGCDLLGRIRATAVDKQNQLWIGTDDGNLYIAKYLK